MSGSVANALILLLAFMLGAVLGGQILSRLRGLDLRASGSGNLGATNALRSGGVKLGLMVLLIDAGKAYAAVTLLPELLSAPPVWLPWACGLLAVLGHVFSPFAGFRGGKGAASAVGASLALLPMALALGLTGFIIALLLSGYVSLSVLLATTLVVFHVACLSDPGLLSISGAFAGSLWLLLLWTHRENLARLAQGTENRFDKIMLLKPRR